MSCNSQLRKADESFWRGDLAEIHLSYLDHLRRCEQCARELDYISSPRDSRGEDHSPVP
jgi:hypothetical protein